MIFRAMWDRRSFATSRLHNVSALIVTTLLFGLFTPVWTTDLAFAQSDRVRIVVAEEMSIIPAAPAPFTIELVNRGSVTDASFIYIRDLPKGSSLNEGFKVTDESWAVPIGRLQDLKLLIPQGFGTPIELRIQVLTPEGKAVANAATMLFSVDPESIANLPATRPAGRAPVKAPAPRPAVPSAAAPRPAQPSRPESVASVTPAPSNPAPAAQPTSPGPAVTPRSPPPSPGPGVLKPPVLEGDELRRAERLLGRGDEALRIGNVLAARLFYQRAAMLGLASAALALAQTYDEVELRRLRVIGVEPDPDLAQFWYTRSQSLGLGTRRAAGR
ncbi:MAG: hypothetical protein AAF732_02860 [Pseudomonadota bacterium]